MYTDDSALFCGSLTLAELRVNLHVKLHISTKQLKMNKVVLNIGKTKCIVLDSRMLSLLHET